MNVFQFTLEELEIAVEHFPTKLQFFRSNARLSRHLFEQKIAIRFYKRIGYSLAVSNLRLNYIVFGMKLYIDVIYTMDAGS